jgi:hypothetical protein
MAFMQSLSCVPAAVRALHRLGADTRDAHDSDHEHEQAGDSPEAGRNQRAGSGIVPVADPCHCSRAWTSLMLLIESPR